LRPNHQLTVRHLFTRIVISRQLSNFLVTRRAVLVISFAIMKSFLLLPFAVLIGILIGGWAPREELRMLRREMDDLKTKTSSREKDSRFDAITRMVQIPERATHVPDPDRKPAAAVRDTDVTAAAPTTHVAQAATDAPATATNTPPLQDTENEEIRRTSPEDLQARIEEAKELWATRVQIARSQWLNRLKLDAEATALFDASIDAMNAELQATMQGLADALALGEEMTPELGVRFFNEMTTSLVRTYDDLAVIVPDELRGEASQLEITDFIDPAVAEPLIAVQHKLENAPGSSGRRRYSRGPR
jgi:hypothetical protein